MEKVKIIDSRYLLALDYNKIRFKLYYILENLYMSISDLLYNYDYLFNNIINNKLDDLIHIKKLYENINNLYHFCKIYNYDIIKNINYKCDNINDYEIKNFLKLKPKYINIDKKYYIDYYKEPLELFNNRFINNYDNIYNKLKYNKFYLDEIKILSDYEIYICSLIGDVLNCSIDLDDREKINNLLKIILNNYDYSLFRNSFAYIYDNEKLYNDIKRGKKKIIKIFNESTFDYDDEIKLNPYYNYDKDKIKVEEFEDNYESYYDKIIKYI